MFEDLWFKVRGCQSFRLGPSTGPKKISSMSFGMEYKAEITMVF